MLKLKQAVTHQMKVRDGRSNPAMQTLHWPNSPTVTENPKDYIDCAVTTYVTSDALIIPVDYLRTLISTLPDENNKHLSQMIDILVNDQKNLEGEVAFTGGRGHYH